MKLKRWEFFLLCSLKPLNQQRTTHFHKLGKEEKNLKIGLTAQLDVFCPKEAFVVSPHPTRHLELLVIRRRLVDDDALGAMCKPLIDSLKTIRRKVQGTVMTVREGLFYDDSRKYVRMTFDQALISKRFPEEGVRVIITNRVDELFR